MKSKKKTNLTREERHNANEQQILTYFAYYDKIWRLSKLHSIKHLLENREEFKKDLSHHYENITMNIDSYLYGSFTNGLTFSAISETIMCIEDFLAVFKFIKETEYFVKKIVGYSAGKVTNQANEIQKLEDSMLQKSFMIPDEKYINSVFEESDQAEPENKLTMEIYRNGIATIKAYLHDVLACYKQFDSFHNKYKHGLSVALYYPGADLTNDAIAERKKTLKGTSFCWDNKNLKAIQSKFKGLVIPNYDNPFIKPHLSKLIADGSLLHFDMNINWPNDIDVLIRVCQRAIQLTTVLINNRIDLINPEHQNCNTIYFPSDNFTFNTIKLCSNETLLSINDFQIKLKKERIK